MASSSAMDALCSQSNSHTSNCSQHTTVQTILGNKIPGQKGTVAKKLQKLKIKVVGISEQPGNKDSRSWKQLLRKLDAFILFMHFDYCGKDC